MEDRAQSPVTAQWAPSALSEHFGDETVVLEPVSDRYVRLNASGTRLWELLESPVPVSELARVLAAECQLDAARARADVDAFVDSLLERGLVALMPSASPE